MATGPAFSPVPAHTAPSPARPAGLGSRAASTASSGQCPNQLRPLPWTTAEVSTWAPSLSHQCTGPLDGMVNFLHLGPTRPPLSLKPGDQAQAPQSSIQTAKDLEGHPILPLQINLPFEVFLQAPFYGATQAQQSHPHTAVPPMYLGTRH